MMTTRASPRRYLFLCWACSRTVKGPNIIAMCQEVQKVIAYVEQCEREITIDNFTVLSLFLIYERRKGKLWFNYDQPVHWNHWLIMIEIECLDRDLIFDITIITACAWFTDLVKRCNLYFGTNSISSISRFLLPYVAT